MNVRVLLASMTASVDDCQSPVPAEWPHPSGAQPVVCAFVCLRQPHGSWRQKDIKATFRCEVRHAKVRGPG